MLHYIKSILLLIFDFCFVLKGSSESREDSFVVVKLDGIGDYVLFRNYLKCLKSDPRYSKFKLTLVGNLIWKDLALKYDKDIVDEFIWVNKERMKNDVFYRLKTNLIFRNKKYGILLCPTFSRTFFDDMICKLIPSDKKISWEGDSLNQLRPLKKLSDNFYDKKYSSSKYYEFEFCKTKKFFEEFLEVELQDVSLEIEVEDCLKENIIVIFPGAGVDFRMWSWENFVLLLKDLCEKFSGKIVLAGGPSDQKLCSQILKEVENERVESIAGLETLDKLPLLLKRAKLLISNETSAVHVAAAVDCKAICISNGNHFSRFNPYPEKMNKDIYYIYPEEVTRNLKNTDDLIKLYGNGSTLDINSISKDRVIEAFNDL